MSQAKFCLLYLQYKLQNLVEINNLISVKYILIINSSDTDKKINFIKMNKFKTL